MGHTCSILTFKESEGKKKIQEQCDEWGNWNCDAQERGGCYGGLGTPINFTSQIFDSQEQAEAYLETTFGRYKQTAVRFKRYPKVEPSKEITDLRRRIKEYQQRVAELDKPHYAGVKQLTVKCKDCGSTLAVKYCGKTYYNACPVCGTDLRPATVLEKRSRYMETIKQLSERLKKSEKDNNLKSKNAPEIYWAVACEVHC